MIKVSSLAEIVTQKFEKQIEEKINQIINLPKDIPECFVKSGNFEQLCMGDDFNNCDQCEFYDYEQGSIFSIINESIEEIEESLHRLEV